MENFSPKKAFKAPPKNKLNLSKLASLAIPSTEISIFSVITRRLIFQQLLHPESDGYIHAMKLSQDRTMDVR